MSFFRKSPENEAEATNAMSSDKVAESLVAKWGVSIAFAKPAALIMQGKRDKAMSILSDTPNADGWMKLAQEKAANENENPEAMAA